MKTAKSPAVTAQTLSGLVLFRDLSVEVRTQIAQNVQAHRFESGEHIITHNDKSTDVFFIVSGEVRATIYSYTGRKVSFRDIPAGETFGEWSAIDARPRSSTVVALTDVFVVSMNRDSFKSVLMSNNSLSWLLLEQMAARMRQLSDRVVELSTLGVKNRLHAELLRLARNGLRQGGTAVIAGFPTNEEMANRISTRREAVNRELRRLESIGFVARNGDERIITDVGQLETMVKEATGD